MFLCFQASFTVKTLFRFSKAGWDRPRDADTERVAWNAILAPAKGGGFPMGLRKPIWMNIYYLPSTERSHIPQSHGILSRWFSELPKVGYANFLEGLFFFCGSDDGSCATKDGPWLGLFNLSVRSSSLDTLLKTQQVSGMRSLDGKTFSENVRWDIQGKNWWSVSEVVVFFFWLQTW